jgi:D-amino-acid dehydrogenase
MSHKVLVVGSGIIGIACAHYLSDAAYQVTVLDQGRIGNSGSYGNYFLET